MNKIKKIPIADLRIKLQAIMNYKNPELAFRTLLLGWIRHPQFKSPVLQTLRIRADTDGFIWLKEEEIRSFSDYCGYDLS